jgi:hypothetical protein
MAPGLAVIGPGLVFMRLTSLVSGLVLALACCGAPPKQAAPGGPALEVNAWVRVLEVGPTRTLKLPSQAAQAARDGDTVLIDPGNYDDCAVWRANHLTIESRSPGVVFAGKTCQGKAIFVIDGSDVTVRGIIFTHAAVADHNGAGIRAQGNNLTVEASRFIDNEEGILAGSAPRSTIRVTGSTFRGNGTCIAACAHGIYVGGIALLDVEDSHFTDTHQGHDIKSRALRTVLRGNDISDGPNGDSSYLVDVPNGGDLLMEHNTLSKGPHTDNATTAIAIGEEQGRNPTHSLVIRANIFSSLLPTPTDFVHNLTQSPAELIGNRLAGKVVALQGPGTVR